MVSYGRPGQGGAYHCRCRGRWGWWYRQWWAVDNLMGCLPVVALMVLAVVRQGRCFLASELQLGLGKFLEYCDG